MTPGDDRHCNPGDLDPVDDPGRWEGLVAGITARGASYLASRRPPAGVMEVVTRWARPALGVAASVLVLTAGAGALLWHGTASSTGGPTLTEALMPDAYAGWVTGAYTPTVTDLVVALDEVAR